MTTRTASSPSRPIERRVPIAIAVAGLLAGFARAQQEPAQLPVLVEKTWNETRSLALFEACDRDADDRLDVFEVRLGMVDLQASRDPAVFRRLDTDASGFVEWHEFDVRFRTTLELAGAFRVRPFRKPPELRDPTVPVSDVDPTDRLLGALDADGDGGLSQDEFAAFLRRSVGDDSLADRFDALDLDRSGRLDTREFAPVLQYIPNVWEQMTTNDDLRKSMPEEFRAADRDLSGVIDRTELQAALALIHPSLTRWTGRILAAADRTRNGSLGSAELGAAASLTRDALTNPR